MSEEYVLGLVTESGIHVGNGEFVNEGKIVERAKEAKRLWEADDSNGLVELFSDKNFESWTKEEMIALSNVWFHEKINIDYALDDAETALGLWGLDDDSEELKAYLESQKNNSGEPNPQSPVGHFDGNGNPEDEKGNIIDDNESSTPIERLNKNENPEEDDLLNTKIE